MNEASDTAGCPATPTGIFQGTPYGGFPVNPVQHQIDSVAEGVVLLSQGWRYLYVDDAAARMRGRRRDELEGRALLEVHPELAASELFGVLRRCMQERCSACCDHREGVDGSARELTLRIEPCLDGLILYSREVGRPPEAPRTTDQLDRVCVLEDPRGSQPRLSELLSGQGVHPSLVAGEPAALLEALSMKLPKVVIVDLSHQKHDRIWVVSALVRRFPTLKVLVIAPRSKPEVVRSLTLLGAESVVTSDVISGPELAREIAAMGRHAMPRPGARSAPQTSALDKLTPREREVLGHIANGSDNLKVAATLGIAERTVKSHVSNIFRKMGAENRVELALVARGLT